MSLERYLKSDEGFRKYVELLESMPATKRKALLDSAKSENPLFVETAEKYILTIERITRLPELELTEVLGAPGLKPEIVSIVICSVTDPAVKENLIHNVPRNLIFKVIQGMKDNPAPEPYDIGSARLQLITAARALEKRGKLESVQIPRFERGFFTKNAA